MFCLLTPFNKHLRNRSIKNQISYIDEIMRKGFDNKLQNRFPEGKLFSNAIFSLSIIEFCDANNLVEKEYSNIIDQNIHRILSKDALASFNSSMKPKYGMFYNGWFQYVLKEYQRSELFELSRIQNKINSESLIIEKRLLETQQEGPRILDSYSGGNWPADNLIGLTTLSDVEVQKNWLEQIFTTAEHESGLIHHEGSQPLVIRGSSQALITFCLNEMEYNHIEEYNNDFKKIFIDDYCGVQLVKENEDGSDNMDVDSGPVVFGYGASATIMNIKTQASMKDSNSKRTWAVMNTISIPINIFGSKYYLFKKEPMFDIFMLWGCVELS